MLKWIMLIFFIFPFPMDANAQWYKKWPNYPNVPRITKEQVGNLIMSKQNIALVYAGYEVNEVICSSYFIPYTAVPPNADGSRVVLPFPKDYWVLVY